MKTLKEIFEGLLDANINDTPDVPSLMDAKSIVCWSESSSPASDLKDIFVMGDKMDKIPKKKILGANESPSGIWWNLFTFGFGDLCSGCHVEFNGDDAKMSDIITDYLKSKFKIKNTTIEVVVRTRTKRIIIHINGHQFILVFKF